MVFRETRLRGAYIIESDVLEDARGFFARTFSGEEFERRGIAPPVSQCNLSYNRTKGTLRGMHYQAEPHAEAKIVACISGAIYDVIVDIRPGSETYLEWLPVELSAVGTGSPPSTTFRSLFVPEGFAHGFQTLEDHSQVFYQMSVPYQPEYARGLRWNDPALGIRWPEDARIISDRDRSFPDFSA